MRRNPLIEPRIPIAEAHTDIDSWTQAVRDTFSPFVRRSSILTRHRFVFRAELINLLPLLEHPKLVNALSEAVRMCRRSIYADPSSSHAHQIAYIPELVRADERWLGLAVLTKQLGDDADPSDHMEQLMSIVNGMIEGCLKPRVRFLFGFACHSAFGVFPVENLGLGRCIAEWPAGNAPTLSVLMCDPVFGLPANQWRNIAAHRDYRRTGAQHFEASYGTRSNKTITFSLDQLVVVVEWLKQLVAVCRLASVIVNLEFMSELRKCGLPDLSMRIDAYLIILAHNMRMVGFTYAHEHRSEGKLAILFRDDLERPAQDAIIHASQALDQLALATTRDVAMKESLTEVAVGLLADDGTELATASVRVDTALKLLDRKITLKEYIGEVRFSINTAAV